MHLINAEAINWYVDSGGFGGEYWVTRLDPTMPPDANWKWWLCQFVELHEFAHTHLQLYGHCSGSNVQCALVTLEEASEGRKASAEKLCYTHYNMLKEKLRFIENTVRHGCE